MPATRRRRIVRRAVMVLAGCMLLVAWYIGAWMAISSAVHTQLIPWQTATTVRPVFSLLLRYCDSDLPGADALSDLWWAVNPPQEISFYGDTITNESDNWTSPPLPSSFDPFVQSPLSPAKRPRGF